MLRILVADDHLVLREGLKKIIEQTKDMLVTAEASNGHEVIERLRKRTVDVVLLDISMPGSNGLETLGQIHSKFPKVAVLVLSQHPEDKFALRAYQTGAAGYLTKDKASSELIMAIRKVAGGGKWVSRAMAEKLASSFNHNNSQFPHETLSNREFEILCLIGTGKTVSEVANELCLSVKTVSTYRTRILEKMDLSKTPELILYVLQHKLVPSET